ncbi:hypothetical protein HK096_001522 [Nowakowskiella sp. JEL0078]|nr:hypothetical protein HK096_001522 [Nowakowskiella sp. JEL0078]
MMVIKALLAILKDQDKFLVTIDVKKKCPAESEAENKSTDSLSEDQPIGCKKAKSLSHLHSDNKEAVISLKEGMKELAEIVRQGLKTFVDSLILLAERNRMQSRTRGGEKNAIIFLEA